MAQRLPNPQRAKLHRSYTVEEVARLYGIHRNTVRHWIKRGLLLCDDRRPVLILGADLATFLNRQRIQNKRPCKPGEIYCMRCRAPHQPALGMVDYQPLTATGGNLIGLCPRYGGTIYRRVSLARLGEAAGMLEVRFMPAQDYIDDNGSFSVNNDFKTGV